MWITLRILAFKKHSVSQLNLLRMTPKRLGGSLSASAKWPQIKQKKMDEWTDNIVGENTVMLQLFTVINIIEWKRSFSTCSWMLESQIHFTCLHFFYALLKTFLLKILWTLGIFNNECLCFNFYVFMLYIK